MVVLKLTHIFFKNHVPSHFPFNEIYIVFRWVLFVPVDIPSVNVKLCKSIAFSYRAVSKNIKLKWTESTVELVHACWTLNWIMTRQAWNLLSMYYEQDLLNLLIVALFQLVSNQK